MKIFTYNEFELSLLDKLNNAFPSGSTFGVNDILKSPFVKKETSETNVSLHIASSELLKVHQNSVEIKNLIKVNICSQSTILDVRREQIHSIIEKILFTLVGQKTSTMVGGEALEINAAPIKFLKMEEITTLAEDTGGYSVFYLEFSSVFTLKPQDPDSYNDWHETYLNFCFKEGSQDVVSGLPMDTNLERPDPEADSVDIIDMTNLT